MEEYKWSSYKDYLYGYGITDTNFVLEKFSNNKQEFMKFNQEVKNEIEQIIDFEVGYKFTDEELSEIIKKRLKIENPQDIQKYNINVREEMLKEIIALKEIVSVRQMARVIGIDKKNIARVIKKSIKEVSQMVQIGPKRTVPNGDTRR